MKGRPTVRQPFAGSRQPNRYVPNFHGYCHRCNMFSHRMTDCRKMNVNPSFESKNSFVALQSTNVICYNSNEFGHKSYECRSNMQMSYKNALSTYYSSNVKFFKCQNFGHLASYCQLRTDKQKRVVSDEKLETKPKHKVTKEEKKEEKLVWVEMEKNKTESSLIVQTALHAERKNLWVFDSGCSNHMTRDKKKFIKLDDWNCGSVRFGDNSSIKIKGRGTLNIDGKLKAHDVYYVEGLKHNLLNVSQMCDKGYKFPFDSTGCQIRKQSTGQVVEKGKRTKGNVYNLKECYESQCMMGHVDESWLWHRRLGHVNFDNLVKISKNRCVRNIPQIKKSASTFCDECVRGK